jgi:orotate phosphoribosyltransferase
VLFHYGIFPQSTHVLSEIGVRLLALATWWDVLQAAEEGKYFDSDTLREIRAFLEDPGGWAKARAQG